jgi:hypothetical protein
MPTSWRDQGTSATPDNHPGLHSERDASISAAERLDLSAAFYPVTNMQEVDAALVVAGVASIALVTPASNRQSLCDA